MTPPTSVKIYSNPDMLSQAVGKFFVETAQAAVEADGRFTVALSGGGSPKRTYELLASAPYKDQVPWDKTFIFWGDERFVPADDPENNARMAHETLLDHVPVPSDHIFPISTNGTPRESAKQYASTLSSFFDDLPRFDLILLGLGTNGHTASLFPHKSVLKETDKWAGSIYLKEKDQSRITLTAPVINNARNIAFIAFGQKKAEMVNNIQNGPHQPKEWPAQLINPGDGSLYWFVDEAAAEKL